MRTPLMSDEELDALARRSADAYPDELPLGAWRQLEDHLEMAAQQRQVQRQVRHRVAELFLLEMLLLGLVLMGWQSRQLLRQRQPALAAAVGGLPASRSLRPDDLQPGPSAVHPGSRRHAAATLPARVPAKATRQPATGAPAAAVTMQPTASQQPRRQAGRWPLALHYLAAERQPDLFEQAFELPDQPNTRLNSQTAQAAQPLVQAASALPAESESAHPMEPTNTAVPPAAQDSGRQQPATPPLPAPDLPADSTDARTRFTKPMYRLLLGVAAAPELAGVRPRQLTGPSLTTGLVAEYRLTPRWRVRSGVLYSIKRYEARGSDYRPPASYWTWRTPVDRIEANCRILEIPLDVRYDAILRPTHTFYATAGLTSLLMRNERYTYLYELNGRYVSRSWSLARGSNAPFRLVQLSVGMEHAAGSRWMVQAEPFVKMPLGGVGFGQIKLSSAGLLLGVKYGLFRPHPTAP